jgi:hypothetical protein
MRGGLIYKCRLCGKLHNPTAVPDVLVALVSVVVGKPIPEDWEAGKDINVLNLHPCGDGNTGLSDLVGAGPESKNLRTLEGIS